MTEKGKDNWASEWLWRVGDPGMRDVLEFVPELSESGHMCQAGEWRRQLPNAWQIYIQWPRGETWLREALWQQLGLDIETGCSSSAVRWLYSPGVPMGYLRRIGTYLDAAGSSC